MAKEHTHMQMVQSTQASGKMMLNMVMVTKFGMMAQSTKVNTSKAASTVKESFLSLTVQSTRESSI